eukprot:TRINITY_DN5055_c1_g1_i1.p1 TRINITY_DN5055_c1_g1~~TRINITY_DN5055_c1_g1_i1.p1  ORF type:complete len:781 (+),score=295.31 TRINITY_DN5055_c1_g1_i1:1-2343(+)
MQQALSKIHVPQYNSNVYKEECTLCFKNQTNEDGIYVCLTCYNGGCKEHGLQHAKKFDHQISLNIKKTLKKEEKEEIEGEVKSPPKKITKLAIGKEGGAELPTERQYDISSNVVFWADENAKVEVEGKLKEVVDGILKAEDQGKKEDNNSWEKTIELCEHTLTLQQEPNIPKVDKKENCHCHKCDLKNNLWLCMTCGHIGCGRSNFLGSGGNNHGVEHWEQTRHPVVLKMGTITAEGNASIFCYSCDEDRKVENLPQILLNFGIEVAKEVKTEKTTTELELEQNLSFNWFKSTEEGKLVYGKGFTGLINIGNSCYMNSVVQSLYVIPQFTNFFDKSTTHHLHCKNTHANCWDCQIGKLTHGLLSGEYSQPPKDENSEEVGVAPRMFKKLLCSQSQFDNMNQQDANEFLQFFLSKIEENEKRNNQNPTQIFNYNMEDKLQCSNCKRVRYNYINTCEVPLSLPLQLSQPPLVSPTLKEGEKEGDKDRMEREEKSTISFTDALNYSFSESVTSDSWNCSSCKQKAHPLKKTSFATFPPYLIMPVRKFSFDWVPKKICVRVGIDPETVYDFGKYRGTGRLENEELLDEEKKQQNNNESQIPQELLLQVSEMGFTFNQARKALRLNNKSVEGAIEWLFNNPEDQGEEEKSSSPSSTSSSSGSIPQELLLQVSELGFTFNQARKALRLNKNSVEGAVEWLFSNSEDPGEEEQQQQKPSENKVHIDNGDAKYKLLGFVLHKGTTPQMGHYVAYLKKDNKWYCYDDSRIQESESPPFHSAFIYFFSKI